MNIPALILSGFALTSHVSNIHRSATVPVGDTITLESFTARVSAHHPIVRQARLGVQVAQEEQRIARGAFDPAVTSSWDRKTFGTTAYYDYLTTALSIPTPIGVDLKLGFERTSGVYASPDRRTPSRGLMTAGVSIPIGQRLITDERRTSVTVARAMRDGAVADLDGTVNRVLLSATREYARWYEAERRVAIAREAVAVAAFRLDAIRRRVTNGEAAPLDTVEALLEVVRREVQLTEASQSRLASRLMVESYLWDARGLPDSLPTNAIPVARIEHPARTDTAAVRAIVTASLRTHPDLRRVDARIDQATALRRLASQQRMPYLATEISALGDGGGIDVTPGDDGKVGLTFRSPLLYLRERGRENAAALRVEQGMIDEERLIRDITVLVRTAAGEVEAVVRSVGLQRTVIAQASALVRGEQLRFDAGESTLFLVNARERALLEEEVRLAGLEARQLVAHGELAAASGLWLHERRDRR